MTKEEQRLGYPAARRDVPHAKALTKEETQAHLDRERKLFLKRGGKIDRLKLQRAVRPVTWVRGSWEPDQNAQEIDPRIRPKSTDRYRRPYRV